MAISVLHVTSRGIVELMADSAADIAELPTQSKRHGKIGTVGTGSTCIVYGDGEGATTYGLKSDGQWVELSGTDTTISAVNKYVTSNIATDAEVAEMLNKYY